MQKTKISFFLILVCFLFSLGMGISDIDGFQNICQTDSCIKIHESSFARLFGIPLGFFGAIGLFVAMVLHYFKNRTVALVLWALCGFEAYFTFMEAVYIQSWCILCVLFFGFLLATTIFVGVKNVNAPVAALLTFFLAHFLFFYPDITLKPTLIYNDPEQKIQVEIFASPSCDHCHEAIKELRTICPIIDAALIIRPVCISGSDTEESVTWVCRNFFKTKTGTSRRLAEKIIWENEQELKNLCGNIAVPFICIKYAGEQQIYRGWNDNIKKLLYGDIADNFRNSTNTGEICSAVKKCG